jgi:hypothetical protein
MEVINGLISATAWATYELGGLCKIGVIYGVLLFSIFTVLELVRHDCDMGE